MGDRTKRLTIDVDERLHRRLKARAATEGVSVRELSIRALERELGEERPSRMSGAELVEHLRKVQRDVFGDRVLPGDSAALIREAREERSRQMDQW